MTSTDTDDLQSAIDKARTAIAKAKAKGGNG